jgi:hypothetical protein
VAEEKNYNVQAGSSASVFSKRIKAGKKRTYFFDVRTTRGNDYYICITESKKRFDSDSYERHKLHLYKEDFNKFVETLGETVNHVKTQLMPDYDFTAFDRDENYTRDENYNYDEVKETPVSVIPVVVEHNFFETTPPPPSAPSIEHDFSEIDKW